MPITMRSYSAATDRQRVIDFRRACTTLENIRDYPTVVDLYKLLDTSTSHEVERINLWEDESGDLAAYAIVALQYCNCYFHTRRVSRSCLLEAAKSNIEQRP